MTTSTTASHLYSNSYYIATRGVGNCANTGSQANYSLRNITGYRSYPTTGDNKTPTLEIDGSILINGKDLEKRLATIENMLMIPERDILLEKKYPKLKKKYTEYMKLLSSYRMWENIKGDTNEGSK